MVLDGDGNRWNAHVDPASGNTYYVNERTGVSSWTLPKKGTAANGAASGGASPLKLALGVAIPVVGRPGLHKTGFGLDWFGYWLFWFFRWSRLRDGF